MGRILLFFSLANLCACTCRVPVPQGVAPAQSREELTLYRHPMEIRLSQPASPTPAPILVIYATGDGGWRGVDSEVFQWIADSGLPIAGFSSKNYLKNLRYVSETDTTTPRRLARDYRRIIEFARRKFGLTDRTPVLLVGNSRGAGLSVVAAGQGELKPQLAGVIGIALTKEEEHVLRPRRRMRRPWRHVPRELLEIKTYQYLPRLASYPVCVIQSTRDHYLPAEAARQLFGPDGPFRRFRSVVARNHSFGGACETLHEEVLSALSWVDGVAHPATSAAAGQTR